MSMNLYVAMASAHYACSERTIPIYMYMLLYLILLPHSNSVGIFLIQYQQNHLHSLHENQLQARLVIWYVSIHVPESEHMSRSCLQPSSPHDAFACSCVFEPLSLSTSNTSPLLSKECMHDRSAVIITRKRAHKTLRSVITEVLELESTVALAHAVVDAVSGTVAPLSTP